MRDIPINAEWENLDEAFESLVREVTDVVRGVTVEAWNLVLQQTPQFYGRAVASWTYSIGTPAFVDRSAAALMLEAHADTFRTDPDEGDVFMGKRKGDPAAIGIANFASAGHELPYRLGDTIFFGNGVDHGEGSYANDLELPSIYLRPVNQPGRMVRRSFDRLAARYGNGITAQRAEVLKTMRIGGSNA
jgi:hypothetical protein